MRVLIVDDSVVMRMIVEQVLRQGGMDLAIDEVVTAANGALGLALLEADALAGRQFDLILSDIHMPVMDGVQFLMEKNRRGLAAMAPTVVLTADADDPRVHEAIAAGADGYISKPFTLEEVRRRLAEVLAVAA